MSDRVFIDTNVFVYLFDSDEPAKQQVARNLLDRIAKEATIVASRRCRMPSRKRLDRLPRS